MSVNWVWEPIVFAAFEIFSQIILVRGTFHVCILLLFRNLMFTFSYSRFNHWAICDQNLDVFILLLYLADAPYRSFSFHQSLSLSFSLIDLSDHRFLSHTFTRQYQPIHFHLDAITIGIFKQVEDESGENSKRKIRSTELTMEIYAIKFTCLLKPELLAL